ncbi:hypothetical protein LCGC14_1265540 [marine sediment metagenome]|uniref:Uncharacterized protein n=1 Tax=marine sediment metagenome TaxID=412755 RepID=A0A0F9LKQ4_9ZZZZ
MIKDWDLKIGKWLLWIVIYSLLFYWMIIPIITNLE